MDEQNIEELGIESDTDFAQLDQTTLDASLVILKGLDLSNSTINVYVAKTSPSNKVKRFPKFHRLNCNDDLKDKFREYVVNAIAPVEHVSEVAPEI